MRCNNCGQYLQDDSKFCEYCGVAVKEESGCPEEQSPVLSTSNCTVRKWRLLPGVLAGVLLLSIMLNVVQAVYASTAKAKAEQQITVLNTDAAEKDAEISRLTDTVEKKEGRIETLKCQIDILSPKVGYYDEIIKELKYSNSGFSNSDFHANCGVFLVGKDKARQFSVYADLPAGETISVEYDSDVADISFERSSSNAYVYPTVQPKKEGMTIATFRCEARNWEFKVVIIVIKDKLLF